MSDIMEAVMIVCFGASWPMALYTSFTVRTARGKSLIFLSLVLLGYGIGIINKLVHNNITYVLFFYLLKFVMVSADLLLYFRNRRLDLKSTITHKSV